MSDGNLEKRAITIWQERAMRQGAIRSCLNCEHWEKAKEECLLAPGQRPPAVVLVFGCDIWQQEIPF